ncbi:hypothetical protein JCM8547_004271 [Rhodosporidiobolus lusitaniae]
MRTDAAQASRDRKKEHTLALERRVAELEAQLRGKHVVPVASAPAPSASTASFSSAASSSSRLARSRREASVSSSTSSSSASGRIADLEDENDGLRSQLHLEQVEKHQLRSRLDELEDKLARLVDFVGPEAALANPSPPLFSTTSTPLPRFEPTFAFDTPNLSPLPQPEERAYLEERAREQQNRRRVSAPALGLTTLDGDEKIKTPSKTTTTTTMNTQDAPVLGSSSFSLGGSSSLPSLSSSASSVSSLSDLDTLATPHSLPALLPPFDDDALMSSSTPPALAESYLELEPVGLAEVWEQWAKGCLPASSGKKLEAVEGKDDESALAFLDLSFLHDAPIEAQC